VRHEAASIQDETNEARHHFWLVEHHDRVEHTADLIDEAGRSIVFTRTRHGADRLAKQLNKRGLHVVAIHGGRSQGQRKRALEDFSSGRASALIATDVAARGIHIDEVASVVHFDPPADHKDYLHRSGRTARAGASGTVVCLVTPQQRKDVDNLLRDLGLDAPIDTPDIGELLDGGMRLDGVPAESRSNGHSKASRPAKGRRGRQDRTEASPRRERSGKTTRTGHSERSRKNGEGHVVKKGTDESLYVANLPWGTTEKELARMFGEYGTVRAATIVKDRRNGRSKGFGFVDMEQPASRTAIAALHGSDMDGRDLTVRVAKPRP
jgi:superfamily II DNA/RNA helicase